MKKLSIIVCMFALMGCAGAQQSIIKMSETDVQNVEAMKESACNLLKTWPFYSGLIREALADRISELPQRAVRAMDKLDKLAKELKPTDYQLGESLGARVNMLSEIVMQALKMVAPDVFTILQGVL